MVKNYLGKPVTLILESKDFKFFKYGEKPSKNSSAATPSPQLELQYEESVELDLSKSMTKNHLEPVSYVSQLKQQSEQEEASLKVKVQGEKGYFYIPGKGSPCNSRFLGEMEIRKLQNRKFQGSPIFGSQCPLTLYYFLFIMLIGNYLSISFEKVAIFLAFLTL